MSRETLDCVENRWLLDQIDSVMRRLREVESTMSIERDTRFSQRANDYVADHLRELIALASKIRTLSVFDGVAATSLTSYPPLAVARVPGYLEASRLLMGIRMALEFRSEDLIDASLQDVSQLYETWCFLGVVEIIRGLLSGDAQDGSEGLPLVAERGLRTSVSRGTQGSIRFDDGDRSIHVIFNPRFAGITGDQQPDIVIRMDSPGAQSVFLVLDAKYRLDTSIEYRSRFGIHGPPQDAVNALHRYRDAIALDWQSSEGYRPVVRGVALYPLGSELATAFPTSRLKAALDRFGIGAIPFLPDNSNFAREWIEEMIGLDRDQLVLPLIPAVG